MTEIFNRDTGFAGGISLTQYDDKSCALEIDQGGSSYAAVSPEVLHALADWIIANVPKPEPKTAWDRWVDLAIGATFRVDGGGEYRKISEMQMVHLPIDESDEPYEAEKMRRIWGGYGYDLIEEFTVPLPTKFAAVVKSNGVLWTLVAPTELEDAQWVSANDYENWATGENIRGWGFEVIFAGVEDGTE